ncbi:MAG: pyridoxamine 5'-phosphate oxidase family protein [Phormidesmis sp. RL_2_1]|nr:pyridoxamine 5'-phosphate oxidase family protein [Phormidesmis sp. RL_2_1]
MSVTPAQTNQLKTTKTQVKRVPKRGHYDFEVVAKILDEGLVCHVGFAIDGQPFVIPTAYGRVDDNLYIHGASASRMLKSLRSGIDVCLTVTLLDGLVLARSAYHHSMNYRSVVLFGKAHEVTDTHEKTAALRAFTEHVIPGRWDQVRAPNQTELATTLVLSLPISEASAKIRTGPPIDDPADYGLPVWAGVLPLTQMSGLPIADTRLADSLAVPLAVPDNVRNYSVSHLARRQIFQ